MIRAIINDKNGIKKKGFGFIASWMIKMTLIKSKVQKARIVIISFSYAKEI
jgi:hypothetical protein